MHEPEPRSTCHCATMCLMRFSVSMFRRNAKVLPRWALELATQLEHRGSQAPPEFLGPITALRELRATAAALGAGRPTRSFEDRVSLRNDLRRALDGVGPNLAAAARPILTPVRRDLGPLPELLCEVNGALTAIGLAEAALDALADPALRGAAWDDVRAAFEHDEFAGICELRVKQLAELVESGGADWCSTARRVNRILYDDRSTLVEVGAIDIAGQGPMNANAFDEPAGVALEERLDFARAEIGREPPTGDVVAWVCFRNASLRQLYVNVAGVEFFGHQLWPGGVAAGQP